MHDGKFCLALIGKIEDNYERDSLILKALFVGLNSIFQTEFCSLYEEDKKYKEEEMRTCTIRMDSIVLNEKRELMLKRFETEVDQKIDLAKIRYYGSFEKISFSRGKNLKCTNQNLNWPVQINNGEEYQLCSGDLA